jgi:hypothetical protein
MKDLTLDRTLRRDDRGAKVRLLQEWLSLHEFGVVPDGHFGPATEAAVCDFQEVQGLEVDGEVGPLTFEALVAQMKAVLLPPSVKNGVAESVVGNAKRHLAARPREVGGENCGPWVRLYMGGKEGKEFAWCAGFACFVLRQACEAHGVPMPITASVSCDSLAASARQKGVFLPGKNATSVDVTPGSLFLNRRTPDDWTHVGIVVEVFGDHFKSIEGNTNDEGSREGYEVCARTRGYDRKDFIRI